MPIKTLRMVAALCLLGLAWPHLSPVSARYQPADPLFGINYGPFREGQAPEGPWPSAAEIREDLELLYLKADTLRIYSAQGISATIVAEAKNLGLQVVLQAWISSDLVNNQREVDDAIALANSHSNVIGVLVGSEVFLRDRLGDDVWPAAETYVIDYIQQVQSAVTVPVGYADGYFDWQNHKTVAAEVDWVGLHSYGFWNCVAFDQAAQFARDEWLSMVNDPDFAGKRVILFETGWPNAGEHPDAGCSASGIVGSETFQASFTTDMLALADSNQIDLFLFELADEPWKCIGGSEATVGCHWGMLNVEREPWAAWNVLPDRLPLIPPGCYPASGQADAVICVSE